MVAAAFALCGAEIRRCAANPARKGLPLLVRALREYQLHKFARKECRYKQ